MGSNGAPGLTKGLGAYIFGDGPDAVLYNCSGLTEEQWYAKGEKHYGIAIYFLLSGMIFEITTFTAVSIIYTRNLLKMACYRIMFVLGLYEMYGIFNSSIIVSYYYFYGSVFCTSKHANFTFGSLAIGSYAGCCYCIVLLALNRLASMSSFKIVTRIFDSPKFVDVFLCLSVAYAVFGALFTMPFPFNSRVMIFTVDPLIYPPESGHHYGNDFHSLNDLCTCAIVIIVYTLIAVMAVCMTSKMSDAAARKLQKPIFVQCFVICFLNAICQIFYVMCQWPSFVKILPPWAFFVASLAYQWSSAASGIMNILVNRTINFSVRSIFNGALFRIGTSLVQRSQEGHGSVVRSNSNPKQHTYSERH